MRLELPPMIMSAFKRYEQEISCDHDNFGKYSRFDPKKLIFLLLENRSLNVFLLRSCSIISIAYFYFQYFIPKIEVTGKNLTIKHENNSKNLLL
jgi:hypothetical protein